jgi:O-antigen/teichoic acid export membrane protein
LCIRATREIADSYFVFEPAAKAAHKVSPDRVSWSYFAKRCYAEGLSKAHLTHLVGASSSLESEGHYVRQTLVRAILRNLADVFLRRQPAGLARIAAIMTGLGSAGAGFALGRLKAEPQGDATPKAAPSPVGGLAHAAAQTQAPSGQLAPLAQAAAEGNGAPRLASGLLNTIRTKLGPHLSLFSNAGLLGLGTGVASVFGFLYWWLAARTFPAAAVGYAAAAISLMNFLGHVGETGLGALVMGDVHRFKDRAGALISGALLVSAGCSAFFGLLYLSISAVFPVALGDIGRDWGSVVFVIGCGLTGLTIVLDQAMVGTMQSQLQLLRNTVFSFVKLALLGIATLLTAMFALHETTILDTWIIGQIVSMVLLAVIARKRMKSVLGRPDVGLLRPLLKNVLGHHGLNLANLAPSLLMPFVVTVVLTPSVNAAFYAAWTVINVAYLVPASLATVVFTVGAKDPAGLSAKLRMSLGASLACGLGVAIVCFFGSNLILSMFSPAYARVAGLSFSLLGLSIFPIAIKYHYVSIQRLRNRMVSASLLAVLGCALELAGAIVGGLKGDLLGLTLGWLIGLSIEAAVMMPVVLAALPPVAGMMRWSGGRSGALALFGLATASSEDRG